jgi:ELWxxDGT repeat protein
MIRQHRSSYLSILTGAVTFLGVGLVAQSNRSPEAVQSQAGTADQSGVTRPAGAREIPRVLTDINPSGSSDAAGFVGIRGAIYFRANDGMHGAELWRTDGTPEGTAMVADINPGDGSSAPDLLKAFRGRFYFAASTATSGREVWSSDGTEAGTSLLRDINPAAADAQPTTFVRFGDALYFRAQDGATGLELWKTQGTEETTVQVADLHPGGEGSIPTYPTVFRDALFFSADDAFTPGLGFDRELWRTDGTADGTTRVRDINPGKVPSIPGELTRLGELLIFKAGTAEQGGELWRSDGTEDGTQIIADMNPGPSSSFPTNLTRVGSQIYFAANDGQTGRELWRTDGTSEGTVRLTDINPGPGDAGPIGVAFRGGILFTAGDPDHGRELWFSDGTPGGARLVKDIIPGPPLSSPLDITVVGRVAYFAIVALSDVGDGSVRTELWRSDGTEAGTQRVWQAPGRFNGYSIRGLTAIGGTLIFTAPTQADANGIAADFEPYILRPRVALDAGDDATDPTEDETALDSGTETDATVDQAGLPVSRPPNP